MTDSPATYAPLDPKEKPILDSLLYIRDKLSLLKQDRSTYIKSKDVLDLYKEVIKQVQALNDLRDEEHKPHEQSRGGSHSELLRTSRNLNAVLTRGNA